MCEFIRPSSQAFSRTSCGHEPSLSYSQATGRISFAAKSCAISRSAFCSSVSVKSTTVCSLGCEPARLTGQSMIPAARREATRRQRGGGPPPAVRREVTGGAAAGVARAAPARETIVGMQDAFGIVLFVVVFLAVVGAVYSLLARGKPYDQI